MQLGPIRLVKIPVFLTGSQKLEIIIAFCSKKNRTMALVGYHPSSVN